MDSDALKKLIKRPEKTIRSVQRRRDTRLTDYTSRESTVSTNRFDVPHIAEKLAEILFWVTRGGVGRSHTVWATRKSHDAQCWLPRTNPRMDQDSNEFLQKWLRNFPVMREHLPMSPGDIQPRTYQDHVMAATHQY